MTQLLSLLWLVPDDTEDQMELGPLPPPGETHRQSCPRRLCSWCRVFFLGIETSCDETAAAVFTDGPAVLSSVVASQTELHARFSGVVPEVAARAHMQRLLPVIDEALRQANLGIDEIGAIAVHNTPGLVGALL